MSGSIFRGTCSGFEGCSQRVSGVPVTCFSGLLSVFPQVHAACFRGFLQRYAQQSSEAGLQRETHQISGVLTTGFRLLHATVFRVLAVSDLWEEGRVHAEGCEVPEGVSAVESCRKEISQKESKTFF